MPDRARNPLFQATTQTPAPEPPPARNTPAPAPSAPAISAPLMATRADLTDFAPTFGGGLDAGAATNIQASNRENLIAERDIKVGKFGPSWSFWAPDDADLTVETDVIATPDGESNQATMLVTHTVDGGVDETCHITIGMLTNEASIPVGIMAFLEEVPALGALQVANGEAYRFIAYVALSSDTAAEGSQDIRFLATTFYNDERGVPIRYQVMNNLSPPVDERLEWREISFEITPRAGEYTAFFELAMLSTVDGNHTLFIANPRLERISVFEGTLTTDSRERSRIEVKSDGIRFHTANPPDWVNPEWNYPGSITLEPGYNIHPDTGEPYATANMRFVTNGLLDGFLNVEKTGIMYLNSVVEDDADGKILSGGLHVPTGGVRVSTTWVPSQPGDVMTARLMHDLRTRHYSASLDNGTATSFTAFLDKSAIMVAPCDLTMSVHVFGNVGFSAAPNAQFYQVWDESNANITYNPDGYAVHQTGGVGAWHSLAMLGAKDYTAGQTVGFKLAYKVNTSNTYCRLGIAVSFSYREF